MTYQLISSIDRPSYRVFHRGLIASVEPMTCPQRWELIFDHDETDSWKIIGAGFLFPDKSFDDIRGEIIDMMETELPKRIERLKISIELDTMELKRLLDASK